MESEYSSVREKHKSLADLVYEAVRAKIISGEIPPGDWLRQEELSQQFGVSHTPVREALDRLISDGLTERVPHKGVQVATIDEQDIAELYCLRLLLEPIALRLAAANMNDRQIDRLRQIIQKASALTDLEDMPARRRMNREFHLMICRSCRSPIFQHLYELVWNRYPDWMFYEGLHRDPATLDRRLRRETEEHSEMLDAILRGDIPRVEQLALNHLALFTAEDLNELFGIPIKLLEDKRRLMGL